METLITIFSPKPLIEARTAKGLTQSQVAAAVGVKQSHINDIENERRKPSLVLLWKLCRFFEIPMESLFFFEIFNDNSDIRLTKYR